MRSVRRLVHGTRVPSLAGHTRLAALTSARLTWLRAWTRAAHPLALADRDRLARSSLARRRLGFGRLSPLQSNVFTVPGTDSERVRAVLAAPLRRPQRRRVHGRLPGAATRPTRRLRARLQRVVDRAARAVPTGKGTALEAAGPTSSTAT